jgi:two-component system sensor histidine kinase/response regulator
MNGIIGMTDLLLNTQLDEHQLDCAQTVRSCSDGLLVLINDILDFSKIEAGRLELEAIEFELVQECEEAISLVADRAEEKGLRLVFDPDPDLPRRALGDPGRIRQILINLVGNAVKFTEQGSITVGLAVTPRPGGWTLAITVSDTGIGIPDAAMNRLFQPFVQADASTTRRFGGTGLGLVICRRLAEMMGGQVSARSTAGSGSVFTCVVQLGQSAKESSSALLPALHGRTILVAAPEVQSRALARRLRFWGAEVQEVAERAAAEAWLAAQPEAGGACACVLIDRDLPGGALEAAQAVPSQVPRIFLAPIRDQDFITTARGLGAILNRPVRHAQCAYAIASALGQITSSHHRQRHQGAIRLTGKVLVAEDNPVNQRVLLAILKRLGVTAQAVGNGAEAVAVVRSMPFDLVLMDCQMPDMDGYTAAQAIRRAEPSGRHLPILALTADVVDGTRERCLAAGMDDYLTKPIRQAELSVALSRWLKVSHSPAVVEPVTVATPVGGSAGSDCQDEVVLGLISELGDEAQVILTEICARFHADGEALVAQCAQALGAGDLDHVGQLAHRLRGQGLLLGMESLVAATTQLEALAKVGDQRGAMAVVGTLGEVIARAQAALCATCTTHLPGFSAPGTKQKPARP